MAKTAKKYQPQKGRKVFVKCFRHWRTGKLVYPKTVSCFCFTVGA